MQLDLGDTGNAFYVVMSGEVSVQIPLQKVEEKNLHKRGKTKHTHLELQEVSVLTAGAYFGELALLNDAPRTATVVCKTDCDLAVLFRDDFKDVLCNHLNMNSQVNLLSNHSEACYVADPARHFIFLVTANILYQLKACNLHAHLPL